MLSKRFAGVYVGNMHFDAWNIDARQRVAQRDAGVGKSRRINNDELGAVGACLMNRLDHLLFAVALQTGQTRTGALGFGLQAMVDLVQRLRAIDLGLASPQQIEVGSM